MSVPAASTTASHSGGFFGDHWRLAGTYLTSFVGAVEKEDPQLTWSPFFLWGEPAHMRTHTVTATD